MPRSRNISLLYGMQAAAGALLSLPIIVLFLQSQGLSLGKIFLLQTVFGVTMLLGEIPTGYISDRWGRRRTLILGTSIRMLGLVGYCVGGNFWAFVLAEALMGTGQSFLSGTLDAFAYDTLIEEDRTRSFRRIIGQSRFWFFGAEGIASVLGGFLGAYNLRWPFWASLIPFGLAVLLPIFAHEPRRHVPQETHHVKAMWRISVHALVRHPAIRLIIILHAILATLGLSFFWFSQPYQTMVGLPVVFFGAMHGVAVAAGAIASKYVHTLERWMDDRLALLLISIVMVGGYLIAGLVAALPVLLVFPLMRVGWAVANPLTSDMVNRMTTSDMRATVLSAKAFGNRLLFAATAPLLGYAADVFSLQTAILLTGVIGGLAVFVTFISMRRVWGEIPK